MFKNTLYKRKMCQNVITDVTWKLSRIVKFFGTGSAIYRPTWWNGAMYTRLGSAVSPRGMRRVFIYTQVVTHVHDTFYNAINSIHTIKEIEGTNACSDIEDLSLISIDRSSWRHETIATCWNTSWSVMSLSDTVCGNFMFVSYEENFYRRH